MKFPVLLLLLTSMGLWGVRESQVAVRLHQPCPRSKALPLALCRLSGFNKHARCGPPHTDCVCPERSPFVQGPQLALQAPRHQHSGTALQYILYILMSLQL